MGWLSGRGLLRLALVAVVTAGGYYGWKALQPASLPPGFAGGNGRIEGTEIDVATRIPGRIREILVNEGDFVAAGEVLARMDTATLEAQLREAQAQLRRAEIGVQTARNQVTQREAEKAAAEAMLRQREVEQEAARRRYQRTEELAARGNAPQQTLDDDHARLEGARAAESAARAQIAAAGAAIGFARSQMIGAGAEVEAMRASVERIEADIGDSALTSPRDGRVQYRVSQTGEVLGAGGRVLSLIDLSDVYMTLFLPTAQAGRVAQGAEARIVLDAAPEYVIPASISFVASVAQFTPRTVETEEERLKLMFRVRARIAPELLRQHRDQVKVGLPGMAYVRLDPRAEWPEALRARLPP